MESLSYSSTEASVSYCECEACQGGAHPELVYTEIVDEREMCFLMVKQELVVTPLGVEGLPFKI